VNASQERSQPVRVMALRSVDGPGGGAEAILLRTAAQIDPQKVWLSLCCIRRTDDAAYDLDRRAAALGIDYHEVQQRSILDRSVLPALREVLAGCQPQIVDAHDYKAAFFAFRLARRHGVIPMATLHGWSGHSWRERLIYYPGERLLAARFPLAVAVSGPMRDAMLRWGGRPERLVVLRNGIAPERFRRTTGTSATVRAGLEIAADDELVGAVGRLDAGKRFDVLLEAVARLAPSRPKLRLIVVGEGRQKEPLRRQMQRLAIADRCRLLGYRSDLVELYQALDVFVQSSDHEGSPTVIVEAMAMETPVVATMVGGTADLIEHNVHGLLIPRRDPAAMAVAIAATLDDRQATARRVAAARARTENELSFDCRTRNLEQLYVQLAAADTRTSRNQH
jgi:glycosyltransferase involved in cell wall biosynthesis